MLELYVYRPMDSPCAIPMLLSCSLNFLCASSINYNLLLGRYTPCSTVSTLHYQPTYLGIFILQKHQQLFVAVTILKMRRKNFRHFL